jgi:hypothetical protein
MVFGSNLRICSTTEENREKFEAQNSYTKYYNDFTDYAWGLD